MLGGKNDPCITKADLRVFPERMGRECPRVDIDYRNAMAVEIALLCVPVVMGGSDFMARLMIDNVLLAPLSRHQKTEMLRRVRIALNSDEVSEAMIVVRDRAAEKAKRERGK